MHIDSKSTTIGVLVPPHPGGPGHPRDWPLGAAALALEAEGVAVVFGHEAQAGRLSGMRATDGGWRSVEAVSPAAAYDRYPSRSRPEGHRALMAGLGDVPVANPASLIALCSDKVRSQGILASLGMPELEVDPDRFAARLQVWGAGFLKPRFGAFGRGVRYVVPGDRLPARGPGAVPGIEEPLVLQRAVIPPEGWAGVACRALVQRGAEWDWEAVTPVVRRHRTDPVVNHARGAEVVVLPDPAPVKALALEAARALVGEADGDRLIEVGVDVVLDRGGRPWLIEVNGRPRGHLAALALADPSHAQAHLAACARPIRALAARYGGDERWPSR